MKLGITSDNDGAYWLVVDGNKVKEMSYEDIQELGDSCSFALLDYEARYKGEHGVTDWFKKKEG